MVALVMFFFLKMFMKKKFVALQIKPIFSYQKYFNQSQKIFLPKKTKLILLKFNSGIVSNREKNEKTIMTISAIALIGKGIK